MQKFLYKLREFMYGRNGIDGLEIFLFVLYFIINNISIFTRNGILNLVGLIILGVFIFRFLSRNVYKRRQENQFFMKYFMKVYRLFSNKVNLAKDRARVKQTHKIYLCPKCKKKLKVPKGKGKIEIRCPCGNKFYKRT